MLTRGTATQTWPRASRSRCGAAHGGGKPALQSKEKTMTPNLDHEHVCIWHARSHHTQQTVSFRQCRVQVTRLFEGFIIVSHSCPSPPRSSSSPWRPLLRGLSDPLWCKSRCPVTRASRPHPLSSLNLPILALGSMPPRLALLLGRAQLERQVRRRRVARRAAAARRPRLGDEPRWAPPALPVRLEDAVRVKVVAFAGGSSRADQLGQRTARPAASKLTIRAAGRPA